MDTPGYLQGNIDNWQREAEHYVEPAEEAWASPHPYWGIWQIDNADAPLLADTLERKRCIELGCGTAYVSAWMTRLGGEVTAIDPTPAQRETAARLQRKHKLAFDLREGHAEDLSFAESASYDFAISEYGASLWADPYAWIPEAYRVLKPGGELVFLSNSPLAVMCMFENDDDGPASNALLRPYFDLYRSRWPDAPEATEFHLPHGVMIDLLVDTGFRVQKLLELQAPADATTRYPWIDASWANQWPSEEVWFCRKPT